MIKKSLLILLIWVVCVNSAKASALQITNLKCEYLTNPRNIDGDNMRFSWALSSDLYEVEQRAYNLTLTDQNQSVVASTGWITSSKQSCILKPFSLNPNQTYHYSLEVLDNKGMNASTKIGHYLTTGLRGNFEASWITDDLDQEDRLTSVFRKTFQNLTPVSKATLYISSAGFHDILVNNSNVGDFLSPSISDFSKRIYYKSYDVTSQMKNGENIIDITLGNGWFNFQPIVPVEWDKAVWRDRPCFIFELILDYSDGTTQKIHSDNTWNYKVSPIVANHIFLGESYDQSYESANNWFPVIIRDSPTSKLVPELCQPITQETLDPIEFTPLSSHNYLYKFPINFSGNISLDVPSTSKQEITITYGEQITNGHVDNSNFGSYYASVDEPIQTDHLFIEDGNFRFKPRFSYKGFQYIEINSNENLDLKQASVKGYFTHTDMDRVGYIRSSDEILNSIHGLALNSYQSNAMGFFTDCPQREKNGWTADAHLAVEIGLFNFDAVPLYLKFMEDHVDSQSKYGVIPLIVPSPNWGYQETSFSWTCSTVIIPWNLYLFTGDQSILANYYPMMERFMDFWSSDEIYLMNDRIGDFNDYKPASDPALISTMVYLKACDLFYQIAAKLNHNKKAMKYYERSVKIRDLLNKSYFEGKIQSRSVAELAMGINYGVINEENLNTAVLQLEELLMQSGKTMTTGIFGTKVLFNALSQSGLEDLAYEIATNTEKPSFGFLVKNGATTLPENMNFYSDYFGGSRNHIFFGTISDWIYRSLAGINPDPLNPGFTTILMNPVFPKGLDSFHADFNSIKGLIVSDWVKSNGLVKHTLTIPAGSTSTYIIPNDYFVHRILTAGAGQVLSKLNFSESTNEINLGSGQYTITLGENRLRSEMKRILVDGQDVNDLSIGLSDDLPLGFQLTCPGIDSGNIEYSLKSSSWAGSSIISDSLIIKGDLFDRSTTEINLVIGASSTSDSISDLFLKVDLTQLTSRGRKLKVVSVYPNPSEDFLKVRIEPLPESPFLNYTIYSIDGNIVAKEMLNTLTGDPSIDISSLISGVYLLALPELDERVSFIRR